jgi:hypothetical protein
MAQDFTNLLRDVLGDFTQNVPPWIYNYAERLPILDKDIRVGPSGGLYYYSPMSDVRREQERKRKPVYFKRRQYLRCLRGKYGQECRELMRNPLVQRRVCASYNPDDSNDSYLDMYCGSDFSNEMYRPSAHIDGNSGNELERAGPWTYSQLRRTPGIYGEAPEVSIEERARQESLPQEYTYTYHTEEEDDE